MKLVHIVGARPQFIKMRPLRIAIRRHNRAHPRARISEIVAHTGQHYDFEMSRVFFQELELDRPDYQLAVGSGTHAYQTGEMLRLIEAVLLKEEPDVVLVYGDTNSTLAGALAASKIDVPVAHVEAGVRSFNRRMPEEINRVLTDRLSDSLFCPTGSAVENLAREGISRGVHLVGDVMYDSLLYNLKIAGKRSRILEKLRLESKGYALATVHRAENTDSPARLRAIFTALEGVADSGFLVVVPLHPRTRERLKALKARVNRLRMFEPVSYLDMLQLEKHARIVLTDSGGVQKEAFFLNVPCVILREETEWTETVEQGSNRLAGTSKSGILERFREMLASDSWRSRDSRFGSGKAAASIVAILSSDYPRGRRR